MSAGNVGLFSGSTRKGQSEANLEAREWNGGHVVHLGIELRGGRNCLYILGMGIGKTSAFRAVQAVAQQVPGLKREKLLRGYETKALIAFAGNHLAHGLRLADLMA